MNTLARWVLRLQGIYYVITGIWPLVYMSGFVAITGPKADEWLVRMVGLLAAVIGITVLTASYQKRISKESLILACGSAASFFSIDVYYALGNRISRIYLLDAIPEATIILLLLGFAVRRVRQSE